MQASKQAVEPQTVPPRIGSSTNSSTDSQTEEVGSYLHDTVNELQESNPSSHDKYSADWNDIFSDFVADQVQEWTPSSQTSTDSTDIGDVSLFSNAGLVDVSHFTSTAQTPVQCENINEISPVPAKLPPRSSVESVSRCVGNINANVTSTVSLL